MFTKSIKSQVWEAIKGHIRQAQLEHDEELISLTEKHTQDRVDLTQKYVKNILAKIIP